MEYVQDSMIDLLNLLHKDDRLCIVEFDHNAKKLSPLLRTTNKNKREFLNIIQRFEAKGGTNINAGLTVALETIKYRKYKNPVTGVFLLSDGEDN